jgi:hypothetical protein
MAVPVIAEASTQAAMAVTMVLVWDEVAHTVLECQQTMAAT